MIESTHENVDNLPFICGKKSFECGMNSSTCWINLSYFWINLCMQNFGTMFCPTHCVKNKTVFFMFCNNVGTMFFESYQSDRMIGTQVMDDYMQNCVSQTFFLVLSNHENIRELYVPVQKRRAYHLICRFLLLKSNERVALKI